MAGSLGIASSVIGIGSGLSSLFGGGGSGSGGTAGASPAAADPFASYRGTYAEKLNQLYADPWSIKYQPGYQFGLQSGMGGMQAAQAAQGSLASGNALLAGQRYGQDYGLKYLSQLKDEYGQLSGATQAPGLGQTAASNIAAANQANRLGAINSISGNLSTLYGALGSPAWDPSAGYLSSAGSFDPYASYYDSTGAMLGF